MSAREAMAIGTAGYTAMLAVMALEGHGLTPERGPIAVTGAAGGVGSVAIAILAKRGFSVSAVTGRPQEADYLKGLGAAEIVERKDLAGPPKALAKERWAGAVDSVGSTTLANLLSMTRYGGAVAACGLAGGMDLPASVAPFILRGVCLYGIDSVMCPIAAPAGGVETSGKRPGSAKIGRNDPGNRLFPGFRRRPPPSWPARCAGGSWSKSGKHVQDLSTNGGYSRLGLETSRPWVL